MEKAELVALRNIQSNLAVEESCICGTHQLFHQQLLWRKYIYNIMSVYSCSQLSCWAPGVLCVMYVSTIQQRQMQTCDWDLQDPTQRKVSRDWNVQLSLQSPSNPSFQIP